jgi:hypothetical protein
MRVHFYKVFVFDKKKKKKKNEIVEFILMNEKKMDINFFFFADLNFMLQLHTCVREIFLFLLAL